MKLKNLNRMIQLKTVYYSVAIQLYVMLLKAENKQFLAFCVNYSFKKLLLLEITFFTFFQREHNRKKNLSLGLVYARRQSGSVRGYP